MKTIERILIGIAAILVTLIGIAYLLPSSWQVERSIQINASPQNIDPYVSNLRRWSEWTPWTQALDPTVRHTFEGPQTGAGSTMRWDGDKMGSGTITIQQYDPNRGVVYSITFGEGKMPSTGSIQYQTTNTATLVTWTDKGELGNNPINRYMGLLMSAILKEDFDTGLAKLKQTVESSMNVVSP